jgi:organic hydroperoxide reductase OsmC/OhrA
MAKLHQFKVQMKWTGNLGEGTANYRAYSRNHEITGHEKASPIAGSSDPLFRGDGSKYSPEELLVASLSTCHLLWMLHLCADAGIVLTEYTDAPIGTMLENADGSGQFTEVTLKPHMVITDASRIDEAVQLNDKAHSLCFIARSMNFPVLHKPVVVAASAASPE